MKLPQLHFEKQEGLTLCGKTKGIYTDDKEVFKNYLSPCIKCEQILNSKKQKEKI